MESLRNKVAVVTGGGRGLGAEICRQLAGAGMTVACLDVRGDLARSVIDEIETAGGRASVTVADISQPQNAAQAIGAIVRTHGRLDVLVNNAAIDVTLPVDELAPEDWSRIIATNLNGPYWLCRAAFPLMKEQGGGQVVNITSTAAKRTWANASAYHASKWGLLGLSHALHVEGRAHKIKVTAVVAGGMRTPFLLDRFPDIDTATLQDPRNVAETVLFVLTRPPETVIPEIMVLPMTETSWP
ncbi:MAG: SDR family oxidoreductase [Gammaproteobacteria bacterium]